MKKVLVAFDGENFSEGALTFVRKLSQKEPIMVTGVFIPQLDISGSWSYTSGVADASVIPTMEPSSANVIKRNIQIFRERCEQEGIPCHVHKDFYGFVIQELRTESRFADLLVIGVERFYQNSGSERNSYLAETLHQAECPVVLVPEKFDFPKNNILAYDGGADAVFAIKQFAYLFPTLAKNPTLLVYASAEGPIPEEQNMEEWMKLHFGESKMFHLEMEADKYFATWLADRKQSILVCGAYGRSALSQIFRKSFIADVIAMHQLPLFVTHQ